MTPGQQHHQHLMTTQLLLNSGLAVDFSQLEALMQARQSISQQAAGLISLPPSAVTTTLPKVPVLPLVSRRIMPVVAPQVRPPVSQLIHQFPQPVPEEGDEVDDEEEDDVDAVEDGDSNNKNRPPQKRNPNDLSTAVPVTCMEDFVKMPISTKLNNLKIPGKPSGGRRTSTSVTNRPPRQFPSHYLPKDEDVVVDMAHYPNREFQNLIRQSLPNYLTASQPKRKSLIAAILSTVSGNNGSFIRYWSSRQTWVEVEKVHAEKFTAQALQDAASQRGSFKADPSTPAPSSVSSSSPSSLSTAAIHPNVAAARTAARMVGAPARPPPAPRAPSLKRSSFSVAQRPTTLNEIPIMFKKRPSQSIPATSRSASDDSATDRSRTLSVKFKRPSKRLKPSPPQPRKVSLETKNPLELLSQLAALKGEEESGDESESS